MGKIQELSPELINQIAAGEVIESAHSVVKELMENSMDASATQVDVESKDGGLSLLRITDNGAGIEPEDLEPALKRHATSKIQDYKDLESVLSYGFRGEALASIASVSRLTLESGTKEQKTAWKTRSVAGKISEKEEIPGFIGTKILVEELFFNTPVRRKFLKSIRSEDKKIRDRVTTQALAREDVRFRLFQDGKEVFVLPTRENKKERIIDLFGENFRDHLLEVSLERGGIQATGYISDPDFYKSNRTGQFIFINGRPIEIKYSSVLLKKAYDELLPPNGHPYCFLFFEIDPSRVDVNVHPAKREIRFLDEDGFNGFFLALIQKELRSSTPVSFLELKKRLLKPAPETHSTTSFYQARSSGKNPLLGRELFSGVSKQEGFELDRMGPGVSLSELTDERVKHSSFVPKKHFGVLFETFILAEAEDGFYIIDQHTAHERIRYEEVLRKLEKRNYGIQPLLTPIRIDVSKQEQEDILNRKKEYEEVGIFLDPLGEDSIVLREIPAYMEPGQEKEIVLDFLNRTEGKETSEPELYDLMAKCVACRSAIKKGDQLSDPILAEILNRLSYCENPSRCPHGRPTLVKLSRDDLERMFHRK
ncbi:DNA mismatch repair endonuclease MutL [Leptospira interrogans]|uniref:DNA mismatch repair protein MutL n=1 Tax=Leptospira interrogans serovar Lora str. TE 1992 TaxID=1193028 RepID=M3DLP1_LEPIR|nr:DNA mismatch repair endonuclease MutL [Leptospira interrogans]EMF42128.1 MutL C-terminal dimerization domain protein [Leptospira interrogans serovar Lora str. TE 1992]AKH76561.1 DNA mismatch repair protein MutL [Leptospira interrogans serovar Bratislava]EMJ49729.1 MutL C-terminal dimerization domain protein [Leptospira interrogans str. UT126]EMN08799.1 MutL C-terminal dimerization domain protein [Leptospira interrogans serovar Muenchen str. Brem 129]KLO78607.1 DNA mismatch repair protein Mu